MKSELKAVFVIGCQRSGTTLLGSLLGKLPKAIVTPESRFFSQNLSESSEASASFDATGFTSTIRKHPRFAVWGLEPLSKSALDRLVGSTRPSETITTLVDEYASRHGQNDWDVWIDHTPENVRYAATLSRELPDVQFVHLVRDGRAVANSVLRLPWGPVDAEEAAIWWALRVGYGLAVEQAYPTITRRIRYEDLVRDPDSVVTTLAEFIGLEPGFAPNQKFLVPRFSRRQHSLVKQDPKAERIDAWRSEMTKTAIGEFERTTYDLLPYLGYAPAIEGKKGWSSTERLVRRVIRPAKHARSQILDRLRRPKA